MCKILKNFVAGKNCNWTCTRSVQSEDEAALAIVGLAGALMYLNFSMYQGFSFQVFGFSIGWNPVVCIGTSILVLVGASACIVYKYR